MEGGSKMNTSTRIFLQAMAWLSLTQALSVVAAASDPVLYHHHTIGASGFLKSSQGKTFQQVWSLPEAETFRKHTGTNLARVIQNQIASHATSGAPDSANLLAPLFDDLTQFESVLDVRGPVGKREALLALKVPEARRQTWDAGLRGWIKNEKLSAPQTKQWAGVSGHQAAFGANHLSWVSSGDWLVLGWATSTPSLWETTLKEIKSTHRPEAALAGETWLKVDADLAELRSTFVGIPDFVNARLNLTLTGKGNNLRTDGKLIFPNNLGWTPEPWNLPTNTIHDPIICFTAARGIAPLLKLNEDIKPLHLSTYPNQACTWGMGMIPYLLYAAYPQTGVSNILWEALPHIPSMITNYGRLVGQLQWVTNNTQLRWQGLPFATPIFRPAIDHSQEFMLAGLMPPYASKQTPPPELFSFLSKPNLAYYDWEITEERVLSWRRIVQAALIGFFRESTSTNHPSFALGETLSHGKRLGNSVTELTVTAPNELTIMRQSSVGFTGMEIVHLMRWVDSPGFPFQYGRTPPVDMKADILKERALHPKSAPAPTLRPLPKHPAGTNGNSSARPEAKRPAPNVPVPPTPPAPKPAQPSSNP